MISVESYKSYVRSLPCIVTRKDCSRAVDPHHLEQIGAGRDSKIERWEDYTRIPLCRRCHSEQDSIGWLTFQSLYAVDFYFEGLIILAKWIFNEETNDKRD